MNWLARNGVRMEQNYANAWCSPSRAALLTGKYPHNIGRQVGTLSFSKRKVLQHLVGFCLTLQRWVLGLKSLSGLKADEVLMPAYLKALGYETHAVGK